MKSFLRRNTYFILLFFVFIVSEIIADPLGNFPLNDDWSYAKSVVGFYKTGMISIGTFPAMSLYTQILWGYAITKLFGLSFFVLRCSSIISAAIGFAFFYKLILQISGSKQVSFLACLVLMFNPLIFNLTNTFMTDVNFNTLAILCCYFMYNFFLTRSIVHYCYFVLFSTGLILLRQYGIIFPACFIVSVFFVREGKTRNIILALISFVLVAGALRLYENYLSQTLPDGSTYKFSGNIHLTDKAFWQNLLLSFRVRRKELFMNVLVYIMPFAIIFLIRLIKQLPARVVLLVMAIDAVLIYFLFTSTGQSSATVFAHMILGNETFYESCQGARHNVYENFDVFYHYLKMVSCTLSLFVILLAMAAFFLNNKWKQPARPSTVFFTLLVFAYTFMILITESYFDRYHIPLITGMIILTAYLSKEYRPVFSTAIAPMLFWGYVSVMGTKDYLEINRQKWIAYSYLRNELHIHKDKINGGGEINCWNDGDFWNNWDFLSLDHFDYLIQFNVEKGFMPIKKYEFQRYFPYKKDKIYIFVREDAKNKKYDQ